MGRLEFVCNIMRIIKRRVKIVVRQESANPSPNKESKLFDAPDRARSVLQDVERESFNPQNPRAGEEKGMGGGEIGRAHV